MTTPKVQHNNIGLVRLLAASMVIVSHAPEQLDGNRLREPLTRLFGTLSFGDLGVDIFFLISGYLITKSYLSSARLPYLIKRVRRIFPGYLVAYFACVFLVAPFAGADLASLSGTDYAKLLLHAFELGVPRLPGAFSTEHYTDLNGAMWTISYEFRCYIFVMLAGALGLYKRRNIFLLLPVILLVLQFFHVHDFDISMPGFNRIKVVLIGDLEKFTRFLCVFTWGAAFYLYRDRINYSRTAALLCLLCLIAAMFSAPFAEPAIYTLGAYVLFYAAFKTKCININNSYDISYGVYLYAWPITALLLLYHPAITPAPLACFTLLLALCAGTLSWYLVEKPASKLIRSSASEKTKG